MRALVAVGLADEAWGVPTVGDDPQETLHRLITGDQPMLPTDVSHLVILCRPESGADFRRTATLLRAHTPTLNVAVLETAQMPLGMAAVAQHLNQLGLEPGSLVATARQLLDQTHTAVWVRRAGPVEGARPGLWHVVRSWFARSGYLASGHDPVTLTPAVPTAWDELVHGAAGLVLSGELPASEQGRTGASRVETTAWGRDASPGARRVSGGQKRITELAALRWSAAQPLVGATACSGCGAATVGPCPYCHARWGSLSEPSRGVPADARKDVA